MWIGFSRLLIMTEHVLDTPAVKKFKFNFINLKK